MTACGINWEIGMTDHNHEVVETYVYGIYKMALHRLGPWRTLRLFVWIAVLCIWDEMGDRFISRSPGHLTINLDNKGSARIDH